MDSRPYSLKRQKPESQTRAAWPVGVKNTMKNWALTNWLDWFERQRERRAQKATLEPCKADQRGSPPKAKSGSSLSGLHANILWRSGRRWGGGDRSYRSTKNLVTSQCVTGTLFPSTTPSQVPKAAFLVLHLPPSTPRPSVLTSLAQREAALPPLLPQGEGQASQPGNHRKPESS